MDRTKTISRFYWVFRYKTKKSFFRLDMERVHLLDIGASDKKHYCILLFDSVIEHFEHLEETMIKSRAPDQTDDVMTLTIPEYSEITVQKRDGRLVDFDPACIQIAIEKAFRAELEIPELEPLESDVRSLIIRIAQSVTIDVLRLARHGEELGIELIQDAVEKQLMKAGQYDVARRYIVYREERKRMRALSGEAELKSDDTARLLVRFADGRREPLDPQRIRKQLIEACSGFEDRCPWQDVAEEIIRSLYSGVSPEEIEQAMLMTVRSRIEKEPAYSYVTARLLLKKIYKQVWGASVSAYDFEKTYRRKFVDYINQAHELKILDDGMKEFDLIHLSKAIVPERDHQFAYIGLQTLYDRYFLHQQKRRLETPQYFWMRVAMGLALGEDEDKNERAIEFYNVLSSFRFISSTPTLFNAGTRHPQLSSCYLLTVMDDLEHIFKIISDDARLSKWAGGLGNDWTNVRATGAHINGTNGESQGVIPFLKVANDTAVAVNQGGKRKGALCSYLETWHLDIEDFLELRKNTGDERRRTHDMHTANWIPDLFMKRVKEKSHWTLFSPDDVRDLHDLYGAAFEIRYLEYERQAEQGEIKHFRKIEATDLWRKMLTMLFETGHPWITFKDPSNVRSPQNHVGVVHSSNLCTEILLHTSEEESAVCNLGSVNLVEHVHAGGIDEEKLADTVRVAIRMLDNVIDINFYPTPETKASNQRHRPIGLGLMGFQDALHKLGLSYASEEAVAFADRSMEAISYYAILSSSGLAQERGTYPSYEGSKWSQGLLPIDTLDLLERERGGHLDMDRGVAKDWSVVRESIRRHGVRNSNTMAIAPTATIANITGISQSIEPAYKHLYVKSNLSGEFTVVNPYLVEDLKKLDLWDEEMIDDLKYFDGSVGEIERIPEALKRKYLTAFEVEPKWLIECAGRRQKWIDMGQSLNLYIAQPSGKQLSDMYQMAWERGLKTTYYLRGMSATQVEKSTLDVNRRGIQPRWMKNKSASSNIQVDRAATPSACSIDDPDCESCQ